ncbi:hypothetical protein JCM3770_000089 [Rhodotorula araucariae]
MAAAVMRAMTFGSSGSSSSRANGDRDRDRGRSAERAPGRSQSPSSSRTRLAKTLLPDVGSAMDDGVPLSRISSRVTTSAGSPPPAGILLNAAAPPPNAHRASSPSSFYGTQSAASSHSNLATPASASASTSRPPLNRHNSDASSSSYVGPATPAAPSFPPAQAAPGPTPLQLPRQSTIRFAPLPEIRPRSYSTGRNLWIVDDEDAEGDAHRTRLVRVGSDIDPDGDDDGAFDFAIDDDGADERGGKWGSWSETLAGGMWGLSPSTSRRSNVSATAGADDDGFSVSSSVVSAGDGPAGGVATGGSSKLLKAFGLGRSRGTRKKRVGTGADAGGAGAGVSADDALSRTSSVDSEISRRSSVEVAAASPFARPQGSTGIPLRKASTWEVGDAPAARSQSGAPVYYASPARTARRRANYPPVAQRSRHAGGSRGRGPPVVQVEEPKFSEWGAGGVGGRGAAADEDDGSGMAWLKKRRLEREQAERDRKEREAREVETEPADAGAGAGGPSVTAGEVDDEEPVPRPAAGGVPQSLPLPSHLDAFRRGRQAPSRSGTVDSTTSSASTIRPATPPAPSVVGGLSATRPALVIEVPNRPDSSTSSPTSDETPVTSPVGDDKGSSSEEEEEEEEEVDDREHDDDDDDLCAEELAHEEALAAEARRSAKSMGAERYHSATHANEIKVVEPSKHKPLPSPRLA